MKQFNKTIRSKYVWAIYALSFIMILFLFAYQWMIGLSFFVILLVLLISDLQEEKVIREERIKYLSKLASQVEAAGEEVFLHLPIGIILYNDAYEIEWVNPFMRELMDGEEWRKRPVSILSEELIQTLKGEEATTQLEFQHLLFETKIDRENKALYLFDETETIQLEEMYYDEKPVLATIYLDNYEEISRNMGDNIKSNFNSLITSTLNKWADDYHFYIKRTSQDRFFAVLTEKTLRLLESSKFEILDEIRELRMEKTERNPITLSIGIGTGNVTIPELGNLSQSALDLALGRGGDQIAIRDDLGKVRFYGGQTNPMEKRTRVRARVISHALTELVKESDNVIIMGHKAPDMDALGSAIGILNIARSNEIEGYIIFDEDDITTGIIKVIDKIKEEEGLWKHFIGPDEADAIYTSRSLVVVVDTNRPQMVAHEKLLRRATHKVVIDHHRRGEDFIDNPTLVYIEPYASSTAELVTELIEYQPKKRKLSPVEATALLAGIIVDTKSFALRTGSRTFDAASYLRAKGADPVLIQKFLKEDLQTVIRRNSLLERAYLFADAIAIIKAGEGYYDQITIAQTADTLLTIDKIKASFVIAQRDADTVAISARSLGAINVQLIMEAMGGGGHLTNAATQLKEIALDEAEAMLQEKITEYVEGRK